MSENRKTFFMCATDWRHELGCTYNTTYPSVSAVRADRACWDSCGVVEIDVTDAPYKYVVPENFEKGRSTFLEAMKERWKERLDEILELAEVDPAPNSRLGERLLMLRRIQENEEKRHLMHLKVFKEAVSEVDPEPGSKP
jgi:hypothetical protein